jgi:hypothetical protein
VQSVEFSGYTETSNGITLFWDVDSETEYTEFQVLRRGAILTTIEVENTLSTTFSWTHYTPHAVNDYVLRAFYIDPVTQREVQTESNTFTVQWMLP